MQYVGTATSTSQKAFAGVLGIVLFAATCLFFLVIDFNDLSQSLDDVSAAENLQLFTLAFAAVQFFILSLREHRAARLFHIGMTVVCVLFFLRELEMTGDSAFARLFNGGHFRIYEAIVFAAISVSAAYALRTHILECLRFLTSAGSWPYYLAALLLVVGEGFEKLWHINEYGELYEELFEYLSYVTLLSVASYISFNRFSALQPEISVSRRVIK